jgi:chitodextrinase
VKLRTSACALAVATAAIGLGAAPAHAAIPVGQPRTGSMTYYNDAGYGACGTQIDASSQYLVAVSAAWFTSANPNNDPLCNRISVQVTYNGRTITVPVMDECPSCDANHIDLSEPAFAELAPTSLGVVNGITWQFVNSGGGSSLPAPTGLTVTGTTAGSATLSWHAVSGASSYDVYRNGTRVDSTTSLTYTDNGLAASTGYSYTVAAVSSSGSIGASAPAVTATTSGSGGGAGCAVAWDASTSYVPGNLVSYSGHNWSALYYSTDVTPGSAIAWNIWQDQGPC